MSAYFVQFSRSAGSLYATGYDLTVIGGEWLPGITEIDGAAIMLRKDPNAKPGSNGGRPVYHGLAEQELKIRTIVWTEEQRITLLGLRRKLLPLPGVEPKNRSILSEWLQFTEINNITILGATELQPYSGPRVSKGLQVTFTASHWLGAAKDAKKNVTVQPRKTENVRRKPPGPVAPTATAGACGPQFTPG